MKIQIELTPMESYFLGNERGLAFGNVKTQQSLTNPYFIKSSKLPTQTALLGALRYLGIRNPTASFHLTPEDVENIGRESFQLRNSDQNFGKIHAISPLVLMDNENNIYIRKPRNLKPDGNAFVAYEKISTPQGSRLLPLDYDEKEYDSSGFYNLSTKEVIPEFWSEDAPNGVFQTQVRVGINRKTQRDNVEREEKGFFKKEYVLLNPKYRFMFQAEVEDSFACYERTVFLGQGRAAFSAVIKKIPLEIPWGNLDHAFPAIDGKVSHYLYLKSDLYYDGEMKHLRDLCAFSITDGNDHRSLTTNYAATGAKARYTKQSVLLKLISAGSVFLFENEKQKETFKLELEKSTSFAHGKRAGFNHYYESGERKL